MNRKRKQDYSQLKKKIFLQFLGIMSLSIVILYLAYAFLWYKRGGNWIVKILTNYFGLDFTSAMNFYQRFFRDNMNLIKTAAVIFIFFILLRFFLSWFMRYFNQINRGIDALLKEDGEEIHLPAELSAIEKKLNTAKQTLLQRTLETQLAEQRKNDLVMYLAHDIRTPLTSVIGYLSLMDEAPDMPATQKAKYVHITLEKAYRLEKMINEFFEITRYNQQQIVLERENVDLYYMLIQLTDELLPILSSKGNTVELIADEDLTVYGDPEKLARVFNNILKNASAYSYPNTEIILSAKKEDDNIIISFLNKGKTIPQEKLATIFEKFYRLDEARTTNTGGTGLGLSIAQEIVTLHGGTIFAQSEKDTVWFTVSLPMPH